MPTRESHDLILLIEQKTTFQSDCHLQEKSGSPGFEELVASTIRWFYFFSGLLKIITELPVFSVFVLASYNMYSIV
jgi:hypothetical protein